jgi:hypothetical protein
MSDQKTASTNEALDLKTFLERTPPGQVRPVAGLVTLSSTRLLTPEIQLYCDSAECGGVRFFDPISESNFLNQPNWTKIFLDYRCRHCLKSGKTFALIVKVPLLKSAGQVLKFGESPVFAPHIPSRLLSIVGDDQDLFRKARLSESHGLGIGAFVYYRRMVENQKARLIGEIVKVARRVKSAPEAIAALSEAAGEKQFGTAIAKVKDAIPEVLKINGHNPLALLYDLLSDGLHAQTDEECLEVATDIRVLLTDVCDRISSALKDQKEVETALSRMMNRQKTRREADVPSPPGQTSSRVRQNSNAN